ncbi:MAG: tRNA pseudouridine(55) synthase TruB [Actinomycetia bacterium]|nr:tRNA pseudouridine(55) synthase TruB [Actinomycetes bacterium]
MRSVRGSSGLNGVILIDKPTGITSHDVVDDLRKLTGERRIGHAGTLDPAASGLLVCMIGKATTFSDELTASSKTYSATIAFGTATDTDDAQGSPIESCPVPAVLFDDAFAQETIASLIGDHQQVPPAYSAIKKQGQKGYRAARKGKPLDLDPRQVTVFDARLISLDKKHATWSVELTVSKGTYIRALARDLGETLGSCAHLSALRRLRCGEFSVEEAYTLQFLREHIRCPYQLARYFAAFAHTGPPVENSDLAIGVFDGLHLGHLSLIDRCVEHAHARGAQAIMLTFDQLPEAVLSQSPPPLQISTSEERKRLALDKGIDQVIEIPFTHTLSQLDARDFVVRELLGRIHPDMVWVGNDFRFGRGAQADAETLADLGVEFGFEVNALELALENGEKISSSAIRRTLKDGDVERAAALLGRPYRISGVVSRNRGIGKKHGIPTANLSDLTSYALIGDGVYKGSVTTHDDTVYPAAIFVGVPSNSADGTRVLEAHLLEFDGELVDTPIIVEFHTRLRDNIVASAEDKLFKIISNTVDDLAKQ